MTMHAAIEARPYLSAGVSLESKQFAQRLSKLRSPSTVSPRGPAPQKLEEKLLSSLRGSQLALSEVSMHFAEEARLGFLRQLEACFDIDEWDERDPVPTEAAFRTLLRVMMVNRATRRPGIGTDGRGSLTAMWTVERNRLTIECYPKDATKWVLTRDTGLENLERAAGVTTVLRLPSVLSPYDHTIWFLDAQ